MLKTFTVKSVSTKEENKEDSRKWKVMPCAWSAEKMLPK
jgi:hypothetical protein